jgi:hypothetical protein
MNAQGHCRNHDARRGLTLVEILLFAAMFAIAGLIFTNVLVVVVRLQARHEATAQVNQESQFLLYNIQELVADSIYVDMTADEATSTLRLRTSSTTDPTTVFASGTTVFIQETDSGTPQKLTTDRVQVADLQFTRRVNPGARDSVDVSFTMSYNSENLLRQYSQDTQVSVARVGAATFDSDLNASTTGTYALGTSANYWDSINDTIFFASSSNVGIAADRMTPLTRLHVQQGDIYITTSTRGIILKTAGGSCYRYTVSTGGVLTKNSISCP